MKRVRTAWPDASSTTASVPTPRSRGLEVGLGVLLTIVGAAIADVVVVWSRALVEHPRLGQALLGVIAAVVLSHRWANSRAVTTVWWSCGAILLALVGLAGYAWQRIGMSLLAPTLVGVLAPMFPLAVCVSMATGYLWRLCERLLADRRQP